MPVWAGLYTDGEPRTRNGEAFMFNPTASILVQIAVGDIIGYPTNRRFRVIEVTPDLVRMEGPID